MMVKRSEMNAAVNLNATLSELKGRKEAFKKGQPMSPNRLVIYVNSGQRQIAYLEIKDQVQVEDIMKILHNNLTDMIATTKTQLETLGVEVDDPEE